jgi:hypothetical protein
MQTGWVNDLPVVIGEGQHPFPFRIRKLSLLPAMVLTEQFVGRVASCRIQFKRPELGLSKIGSFTFGFRSSPAFRRFKGGGASCRINFKSAQISMSGLGAFAFLQ